MMKNDFPTVLPFEAKEAGKGGKGGDFNVTNADFVTAVFKQVPAKAFTAVCSKPGDPGVGGWGASLADQMLETLSADRNNYFACSSFFPRDDGSFRVKKSQFAACHCLMLDDVGTKVTFEHLAGLPLSWLIETSPDNHQGGIILAQPIVEGSAAVRLLNILIAAGLCDPGASGPLTRWARLPVGINGKPKYANESGESFRCGLVQWHPEHRYTPQEIVDRLQLKLSPAGRSRKRNMRSSRSMMSNDADDVLTPRADQNPVVVALQERGLYKTPLGSGKHDVTCPWAHEHTDGLNTGAAYFEPDELYALGGFCCQHSHGSSLHIRQLLEYLGICPNDARHQPVIRIVSGDLHRVLDAAEKELTRLGRHYQAGGLIVSVSTDPVTGDPSIVPTSLPALTRELSVAASWEKYDRRAEDWIRCDPPARHVGILYDVQNFRHLLPLAGVVRQPYFRESDGELITQAGYDRESKRFAVFDLRQFIMADPTPEAARKALILLEELIAEFHFVTPTDKAAALAAIFTAVVRPTLAQAPAFHVKAPISGSGKSYLCELIGAFAGPGGNTKVSYPTTSEEATKVMLALLLAGPAVVEFDDMDTDWIPHGMINRMLTAEHISDRILGVSKTATVGTRTLFLGSGNNVGPVRDLLRRVVTIHIDPRCSTPALMTYRGTPIEKVRSKRGLYISAVLTIILAWRRAGAPKTTVENIVTFGGAWSDYCRHPVIWLGQPDPAGSLLEQVKHDPEAEALGELMIQWHAAFGSSAVTVRKVLKVAQYTNSDLLDAILEFPVAERGEINPAKLGWLLRKRADRIVGGLKFQQAVADGRNAWRVVEVNSPPLTPLPPFDSPIPGTVTHTHLHIRG